MADEGEGTRIVKLAVSRVQSEIPDKRCPCF
jgi:hypothetical protein